MEPSSVPDRQAQRLIQLGLILFLCALIVGILVPVFGVPRLGLSAHLLGVQQGGFLVLAGVLWPKLQLAQRASWIAFWLLIYGFLAAWSATLLAGIWRAGNTLLPFAAGAAHGTAFQETLIAFALRSSGGSQIVALLFLVWGARRLVSPAQRQSNVA